MTGTNDVVYGEFEYVGELPVVPAARLVDAGSVEDGPAPAPANAPSATAGVGNPIEQVRELAERAVHVARDVASAVTLQPVSLPFGLGEIPVPSVDTSRLDFEAASLERARQEIGALASSARGHLVLVADEARRSVDSTARMIREAVKS